MESIIPSMINILGTEIELLKLLISMAILAAGVLIGRILKVTVIRFTGKHFPHTTGVIIQRLVYWGIIGIAALSAISNLGVDFSGLLLAGGIFGIIIGFATQSLVANLISGLFLQIDKPVKIGDSVEVVDMNVSGVVVETTTFSTILRRFDGVYIRIPNEKFFTSQLRNFSTYVARRVEVTAGIAYKEDAARAIELIKNMLANTPKVLVEPAPNIFVSELGDSSVNLGIQVWVPSEEWFPVRMEIVQRIKEEFDKAGIEIPFPQRTIWFAQTDKEPKDAFISTTKQTKSSG